MDYSPEEVNLPSTSGASNFSIRKTPISCFVPGCPSNSIKFPSKIFLTVPREPNIRNLWMQAVKRDDISPKSIVRCCEDHFDMENDIENWIKYKLVGCPLYVKKGVVPHIFDCEQTVSLKRKRHNVPQNIEYEQELSSKSPISKEIPMDQNQENFKDKCIQAAVFPHKRSKHVQAAIKIPTNSVTVSPKKVFMKDCKTSPLKMNTYRLIYSDSDNDSKKSYIMEIGDTGTTSSSIVSDYLDQDNKKKNMSLQLTTDYIMADPKLYIGVPKDSFALINLIQETIQVPHHHIYLVLRKLKVDEPFKILAHCFGLHESTASRIFSSTCCKIAKVLEKFIIKPSKQSVLTNLPIAFRHSFSKTYCIIDCMEIEIEVPGNALHQSLTYSSYKKCNTIKYLVSATPDGVINFVSEGFGGRTSDVRLCQESKFFDCLPPGVSIMADRGFKNIEGELAKRKFTLIRPPSVSGSEKSSKQQVKQAKKIASLRIHIERVIRRLREFSFLRPHSCIDHNLIPNLDYALTICCALVNLQPMLIKH